MGTSRGRRLFRLTLAAAAALVSLASVTPPHADAGWWDELDKGDSVTLSDLCAEPVRWRGKVVTFACIYNQPDEVYSPYFTSFNAETHWNVTAWLDGSPLWELEAFQRDDFPYLFVPRNHPQSRELFGLQRFTRIEITGKVKDVYRSRPWIEIQAFRVTAATLGSDVVSLVKAGDGRVAEGNLPQAEANYNLALATIKLADVYRTRIQKRLADVLRAAGKDLDARKVEGPSPILGATRTPLRRGTDGTGLPDARAPGGPGAAARPPGELTDDLPGDPIGSPIRPPASNEDASRLPPPPPPIPDAGLHRVAPPPPGTVAPPNELTDDLPGIPVDAGPVPRSTPPATTAFPPPSQFPPLPPAPATDLVAPAAPAPVPAATDARPVVPPPPPRQPRLSGVK